MSVMNYILLKDDLPKLLKGEEIPLINGENRAFQLSILDGLTNGDVIKALFPNAITETISFNGIRLCVNNLEKTRIADFTYSWWNAPYKIKEDKK